MQSDPSAGVLLDAEGIEKSFGATHVLRGVDFQVRAGQTHALLGGNGAGKSTLIRIITGQLRSDGGEIRKASQQAGRDAPIIAVVHQELALLPDLTVAENIGLVHTSSAFSLSRRKEVRGLALRALRLIDAGLAERVLDRRAGELSLHEGQIVEIARALSTGAEVLLLDEPTANLTAAETATLFSVLRQLVREEAIGIVFVSHRMKEIRELCDTCSILRDGVSVVNGVPMAALSDAEIVRQMGQPAHRDVASRERRPERSDGAPIRLEGPSGATLTIDPGTILGLAGAPAGPTRLIEALVGARRETGWHLSSEGLPKAFASPAQAVRAGIGFVSGDRAAKGILSQLPIVDNVLCARRVRERRWMVGRRERRECGELVAALKLKADSIWALPQVLSGGNQQKLLLARWLGLPLRIVVLEEPTRGVDIGTKRDIYALIRRMADAGAIIVWWSTENVELLELCDRIFAFDTEGAPVGFLGEAHFDEDGLAACTGMAA